MPKKEADDADIMLELLQKKFQGHSIFTGGNECLVDIGDIMTVMSDVV